MIMNCKYGNQIIFTLNDDNVPRIGESIIYGVTKYRIKDIENNTTQSSNYFHCISDKTLILSRGPELSDLL